MIISEPVLAGLLAGAILAVFVLIVAAARRFPTGDHAVPEVWRKSVEGRLGHVEIQLDQVQAAGSQTKHDVSNIRMAMQTLPSAKDVYEVRSKVAELSGEVKGMSQSLSSLHAGVGRIENFMMDAAAKSIASVRSAAERTANDDA